MSLAQELRHLWSGGVQTGQDGEDGFLAFQNLLVQNVISLIELDEPRCAEDDHHGVDIVEFLLTIVDGDSEMLRCSRGKDVDGVGHR